MSEKWKVNGETWEGDGTPGILITIESRTIAFVCTFSDRYGPTSQHATQQNKDDADLIVTCVNGIRACAESVGMDPLEFAQALVDYPHVAQVVKPSIEAVKGFEKYIVEGEPLEGGPPTGLLNSREETDVESQQPIGTSGVEEGEDRSKEDPEKGKGEDGPQEDFEEGQG